MSERTVEQVKTLITADLSAVEKAQLIEWLGAGLRQELSADETMQQQEPIAPNQGITYDNGINGFSQTDEVAPHHELPWAEQPWTAEELRELMRPDPKTGAEIVQLLDRLDLSEWEAMDIPDNVKHMARLLDPRLVMQPY